MICSRRPSGSRAKASERATPRLSRRSHATGCGLGAVAAIALGICSNSTLLGRTRISLRVKVCHLIARMNGKWTGMLAALTFGVGAAGYAATAIPDDFAWTFAPLSEPANTVVASDAPTSIVDSATPDFVVGPATPARSATVAPNTATATVPQPYQAAEASNALAASTGGSPVPLDTVTTTTTATATATATSTSTSTLTPTAPAGPVYHPPDYPPGSDVPGSGANMGGVSALPAGTDTPTPTATAAATGTVTSGGPRGLAAQPGGKSDSGKHLGGTPTPDAIAILITPTPTR